MRAVTSEAWFGDAWLSIVRLPIVLVLVVVLDPSRPNIEDEDEDRFAEDEDDFIWSS